MNEPWRTRITIGTRQTRRPPLHSRHAASPVYDVLSYLARPGMSVAEVLDDFPYLTPEGHSACFAYAAERGSATMLVSVA